MEYRLGNSKWVKEVGGTVKLTCPDCGASGSFGVFTNKETTLVSRFPLFKNEDVYFLVCPHCASVYTVENYLGEEFAKGEELSIGNYDLKKLNKFK